MILIKMNFKGNYSYMSDDDEYDDFEMDEEEKGPALEIYGTDLTLLAKQGQLEELLSTNKH